MLVEETADVITTGGTVEEGWTGTAVVEDVATTGGTVVEERGTGTVIVEDVATTGRTVEEGWTGTAVAEDVATTGGIVEEGGTETAVVDGAEQYRDEIITLACNTLALQTQHICIHVRSKLF